MDDVYIANDRHDRLTQALAAIEPCPFTGKREPYQMADVLMAAQIWPSSVGDLSGGWQEQSERGSQSAIAHVADASVSTKETAN